MDDIKIAVINAAQTVTQDEFAQTVRALRIQISRDFAPVWGVKADLVVVQPDEAPPEGCWWLVILDDADMANSLGYHDLTSDGLPLSKAFARTAALANDRWSCAASHELLEMLVDPGLNLTALYQSPFDVRSNVVGRLYSYEVCDPCQSDSSGYEIDGVLVSNFVYPSWFEGFHPAGTGTQLDYMGAIEAPFQVLPGGYTGVYDMTSGTGWQQVGLAGPNSVGEVRAPVGSRRERRRTDRSLWMRSQPQGNGTVTVSAQTKTGKELAMTQKHYWQETGSSSGEDFFSTPIPPARTPEGLWSPSRQSGGHSGTHQTPAPPPTGDLWFAPKVEIADVSTVFGQSSVSPSSPSSHISTKESSKMSTHQPQSSGSAVSGTIPAYLQADPREHSFQRFAEGIGRVRPDGKGLSLAMNTYDMAGNPDGQQICNGEVNASSLEQLMTPPASPSVAFSNSGPVPEIPVTTRCQATWRFADGSTITAIGKGTSHIVALRPNVTSAAFGPNISRAGVMKDAAIMVVTHGTGQYAGARGHVTLDSSLDLPDLDNVPFGQPGAIVRQKSLHTFRLYKQSDLES